MQRHTSPLMSSSARGVMVRENRSKSMRHSCREERRQVTGTFSGVTVVSTPPSGSAFPVGTTTVLCIGHDTQGHTDTATFKITVKDTQPPKITGAAVNPATLSPPDHKMVNVTVNYTATDNCGGVTSVLTV